MLSVLLAISVMAFLVGTVFVWLRYKRRWWRLEAGFALAIAATGVSKGLVTGRVAEGLSVGLLAMVSFLVPVLVAHVVASAMRALLLSQLESNHDLRRHVETSALLNRAVQLVRSLDDKR